MGIRVQVEEGSKRVFASALDWPGWSRSAKSEEAALTALLDYRNRYAMVLEAEGLSFKPPGKPDVVEHLGGDASTDFGAPGAVSVVDAAPVSVAQSKQLIAILEACWAAFDRAAASLGRASLSTGPRGGGRQVDAMAAHVLEAEASYLRRIATKPPKIEPGEPGAAASERKAVVAALEAAVRDGLPAQGPRGGAIWPVRYFVRRAAWHVLDHAWEIEDRLP